MKKEKQKAENLIVEGAWISFVDDVKKPVNLEFAPPMRLRKCNAYVSGIGKWLALTSYSTIVAILDSESRVLYDVLRWRYGYTATSAQHIAKFAHDYDVKEKYTWREI